MNNVLNILDCKGAKVAEYVFPENYFELERGSQAVHDSVVDDGAERDGSAHGPEQPQFL